MVMIFESSRVLLRTDPLSVPLVRNRMYPVERNYSAQNFILENAFIGEQKVPYAL